MQIRGGRGESWIEDGGTVAHALGGCCRGCHGGGAVVVCWPGWWSATAASCPACMADDKEYTMHDLRTKKSSSHFHPANVWATYRHVTGTRCRHSSWTAPGEHGHIHEVRARAEGTVRDILCYTCRLPSTPLFDDSDKALSQTCRDNLAQLKQRRKWWVRAR